MTKKAYKHVLLATELSSISDFVASRAKNIANITDAKLTAIHAIMPSVTYASIYFTPEVQEELVSDAKSKLAELSEKYDIKSNNQLVVVGNPKEAILDIAEELKVDLIVIGSHHHSWFSPLLGSTANNVVSRAKCDVLTIPMREIAEAHNITKKVAKA